MPRLAPSGLHLVSVAGANVVGGCYIFTGDFRQLDRAVSEDNSSSWAGGPSPLRLASWSEVLASHLDREYAAYIGAGIRYGFRVGFSRGVVHLRSCARNHPSATESREVVTEHIRTECRAGRMVGPLSPAGLRGVHMSPAGRIPKSEPNQWRLIVDLSYPRSHSINDGILSELASVSYASVDDAVQLILQLGKGSELVKLDLKQAYCQVSIHPHDHHLFGISWEGNVFVDRALPFGLRSAPKIFTAVSDVIAWAFHAKYTTWMTFSSWLLRGRVWPRSI